jgi:hypothetical protein
MLSRLVGKQAGLVDSAVRLLCPSANFLEKRTYDVLAAWGAFQFR